MEIITLIAKMSRFELVYYMRDAEDPALTHRKASSILYYQKNKYLHLVNIKVTGHYRDMQVNFVGLEGLISALKK